MADITSKARIKGINQRWDRPFAWHVWEVTFNDADAATGDFILLPEKYDTNTRILQGLGQVLVVSNATTCTINLNPGATVISTGVFTGLTTIVSGLDLKTISQTVYTSNTNANCCAFNTDSGIVAGTSVGQLGIVITKTGTGTAVPKILVTALMGRVEY